MKHTIKIIIAMLIWGSIGIFVKHVKLPSIDIVFLRASIASCFLLLCKIAVNSKSGEGKKVGRNRKDIILILVSGVILAFNWILLFQAYKYTTITNATLSYYLAPVFVILLSPIVLGESLSIKNILAVITAMIGLSIIVTHQGGINNGHYSHFTGIMFGIAAAMLYAGVVLLNKSINAFEAFEKTLLQILVSALVLLPYIIYKHDIHITDLKTLLIIVILGVVHTGIAYLLYFSSVEHVSVQRVSLYSYIDPLSAVVFGTIFLGEPIGIYHVLGGALILTSTFLGSK